MPRLIVFGAALSARRRVRGSAPVAKPASEGTRRAGVTRPDLGALSQALGPRRRLLTADIDSIQGRQVGRVLVAAPADADLAQLVHLGDHGKVLGHVDPADD